MGIISNADRIEMRNTLNLLLNNVVWSDTNPNFGNISAQSFYKCSLYHPLKIKRWLTLLINECPLTASFNNRTVLVTIGFKGDEAGQFISVTLNDIEQIGETK